MSLFAGQNVKKRAKIAQSDLKIPFDVPNTISFVELRYEDSIELKNCQSRVNWFLSQKGDKGFYGSYNDDSEPETVYVVSWD